MNLTPNATAPTAPRRVRWIGDRLAWLGGADRTILQAANSGRSHFVQMGLVVLATASVAVLSMSFALNNGLKLNTPLSVFGGILWGCVIAVIDRFLITSLSLRGSVGRTATIVGLRLVIAALLGLVISTPLVLHIFQDEIQAQITLTNASDQASFGKEVNATPIVNQLNQVKSQIATDEAALQGHIPAPVTPQVQSRQQELTQAQVSLAQLQSVSDQKYRAWQCELYGSSCEGSTSRSGDGTLAKARQQEYQTALAQTTAAQQQVDQDQQALNAAQNTASQQIGGALQLAQTQANKELPGLRQRETNLQTQYNDEIDRGDQNNENDTGLLAQITALGQLGDNNSEASITHLAVGALFFMIELLPVLVKILTSSGPASAYERVREMLEDEDVDNAKAAQRRRLKARDEGHKQSDEVEKHREAAEVDMRQRELDLNIKANEQVAKEMEVVLSAALAQWSLQVRSTVYAQSGAGAHSFNGAAVNGAVPLAQTANGANGSTVSSPNPANGTSLGPPATQPPPSRLTQQTVRTNFNLPQGSKLSPSNGGNP